jgi:hypothetical protein
MKINRPELFKLYAEEINRISQFSDNKSAFEPDEVIKIVCDVLEKNPDLMTLVLGEPLPNEKKLIEWLEAYCKKESEIIINELFHKEYTKNTKPWFDYKTGQLKPEYTCKNCKGRGTVDGKIARWGRNNYAQLKCHICDGKGYHETI